MYSQMESPEYLIVSVRNEIDTKICIIYTP